MGVRHILLLFECTPVVSYWENIIATLYSLKFFFHPGEIYVTSKWSRTFTRHRYWFELSIFFWHALFFFFFAWVQFRFAKSSDIVLIILGTVMSVVHGSVLPLMCIVFGDMTDSFIKTGKQHINMSYTSEFSVTGIHTWPCLLRAI